MLFQSILGFLAFIAIAWVMSEKRGSIAWKDILLGITIQVGLAVTVTQFSLIREAFIGLSGAVQALKIATEHGTNFVFGYLGGGPLPFEVTPGTSTFIFAFQALPMIMVVSALSMLLFYLNVLPVVVKGVSFVLKRILNVGGALGTAASAKIFFGNVEAPLLVRPYLKSFSRSELFTIMTCGAATTSASVMALYSAILDGSIPNPIAHILTCSIISIPAAITIAKTMIPQTGDVTSGDLVTPYKFSNWMDAVSRGTSDGLNIFLNITAMLIVVLAGVSLINALLGLLPEFGGEAISMQRVMGIILAPITWLMGVPWSEAVAAGKLLGTKTVLNEVIAFLDMAKLDDNVLSQRSRLIMTYGLCGFANFSAIGIVIGGLGAMVPERRDEIVSLSFKSLIAGTLATCMSGTIIGILSIVTDQLMK